MHPTPSLPQQPHTGMDYPSSIQTGQWDALNRPQPLSLVGLFLQDVAAVEGDPCFWTAMGELHAGRLN